MKTTENNKLIAEFMQFEQLKNNHYECIINNETKILPPQGMLFQSDWNWLMEVIEKIESLDFIFQIHSDFIKISTKYSGEKMILSRILNTKIEAVYNACVDFIKWYNQQTK